MTIFITGATGFIGKNLIIGLKEKGYNDIRCLVREGTKQENIKFLQENNTKIYYGDILNRDKIKEALQNVEIVFHLANIGNISAKSNKAYKEYQRINLYGTENLLQCLTNKNIKLFVYLSSTAVFGGIKRKVINEDFAPNPFTPYAKTKYDTEKIVLKYYQKYKLPVCILRPTMVYGPYAMNNDILRMAKLIKAHIFPLIGTGEYNINLIYVEDLVNGLILATNTKKAIGNTYILSDENAYKLKDIAKTIAQLLNITSYSIPIPIPLAKAAIFFIEQLFTLIKKEPPFTIARLTHLLHSPIYDIQKAKEELNFSSKTKLSEGLEKTINWYKNEKLL